MHSNIHQLKVGPAATAPAPAPILYMQLLICHPYAPVMPYTTPRQGK